MNGEFADAEAMLRAINKQVQQQQQAAEKLAEGLANLRISGANEDRTVMVRINANGGLEDIRFSRDAMTMSPDELREEVLCGVRAAQQHLSGQVGKLTSAIYGSDSPTAAMLTARYAETFGTPEDEESEDGR